MAFTDTAIPADTESVKLGASRIRETREYLNTLASQLFSSASVGALTWLSGVIPGSALAALGITEGLIAAGAVTETKVGNLAITDAKLSNTLNLAGKTVTLPANSVTGAQLDQDLMLAMTAKTAPVKADTIIIGDSAAAGVVKVSTIEQIKAAGRYVTPTGSAVVYNTASSTKVSESHGLGAIPFKYEWRARCVVDDHDYEVGDEILLSTTSALSASEYSVFATQGVDDTSVWFRRNGAMYIRPRDTGTPYLLVAATDNSWKFICYAEL